MIRAAAVGANGRRVMLLGLSEAKVQRMREGKPIHIHADEMGFAGEIIIMVGKDEAALQETLAPLIGPETRVRDETNAVRQ